MSSVGLALRNRALLALMLGHFTNDMLAGVLSMMLPVMKDRFDLSLAALGLAPLAYTGLSSLTQPLFGFLCDRYNQRWFASATLLWAVGFVAAYGFAPSYPIFLLFAALAGVASGAFHPLGASNAAIAADDRYRNVAMSLYTVGGTSGWSLGPLVAAALLAIFGPSGTAALLVPGIIVAGILLPQMRHVEQARQARLTRGEANAAPGSAAWGALARVVVVTMLRSWVFLSVVQFVPVWYEELGFGRGFYGPLATIIILAGAVGTLLGGALADRIGQRRIVVVSLALAIPSLLLFAGMPGRYALLTGALFGITCDASLSVTLVMAQRLVPGRIGVTSGVILGLGFITGGIGVPVTGRLADAVGIQAALMSLGALCALGSLLALTLPTGATRERGAADAARDERSATPDPSGAVAATAVLARRR